MALLLVRVGALLAGLVVSLAGDAPPIVWSSSDRVRLDCVLPAGSPLQARRPPPPLEADSDVQGRILYTWTKNNKEINNKRVFPNGSLEVRHREGSDNVYQCSTKKHGGVVLGYPQKVKFSYIEKSANLLPTNIKAMVGQPAVLNCSIESGPAASYTWTKDGTTITNDTRVYFIQNQLLITEVLQEDTGSYTCTATNPKLHKSKTIDSIQLAVDLHQSATEPTFLPLDDQRNQTVEVNGTAILACPVLGYPRPEILWEFQPRSDGRSMELDAVSQVLERPQFSPDQEGVYICSIINYGLKKVFDLSTKETVHITHPPISKESRRASTVRFNCNATGNPEPEVYWFKDGKPVQFSSRVRLLVANYENNLRQLVLNSLTTDDAGVYQCLASNGESQESSWAVVSVPGAGGPRPRDLVCRPLDTRTARLTWTMDGDHVVAYTIHSTLTDRSLSRGPVKVPEDTITLSRALTPEQYQVRAYVTGTASDLSDPVTCQGQGVPIQVSRQKSDVYISWSDFAQKEPEVREWKLQVRTPGQDDIKTYDLDATVTSYNLTLSKGENIEVRVLGTKSSSWPDDDYSLLGWAHTGMATGRTFGAEEVPPAPEQVEVKRLLSRAVSLRWRSPEGPHTYTVCVSRTVELIENNTVCHETTNSWIQVNSLSPDTEYEVRVQARASRPGPFSSPLAFVTNAEEPSRFSQLNYTFVNATTIKVEWSALPSADTHDSHYTIHYSPLLKLPVEEWNTLTVHQNYVLITGIEPGDITYVMVTAHNPTEHSTILTIPSAVKQNVPLDIKNQLRWEYTPLGAVLRWGEADAGRRGGCEVKHSQNLTRPLELWTKTMFTGPELTLWVPEPSRPTYVWVGCGTHSDVLTLPPATLLPQHTSLYLGIGVGCAVCLIVVLTVTAIICIRKRYKPHRPRRRRMSDGLEDGAEMKNVGGRLANGTAAGQPLLNGHVQHVHITENPALSKTPNGKLKARYEAFDMSRPEECDVTALTTLEADTSTGSLSLPFPALPDDKLLSDDRLLSDDKLLSDDRLLSDDKLLPDDNMNSERTQCQHNAPTLQPNG